MEKSRMESNAILQQLQDAAQQAAYMLVPDQYALEDHLCVHLLKSASKMQAHKFHLVKLPKTKQMAPLVVEFPLDLVMETEAEHAKVEFAVKKNLMQTFFFRLCSKMKI